MAKNKKSFILYVDLIHTINQLTNEKAGILFKHILEYVNDKNPISDDLIINIAFEPIKQQLKRDLKKYKDYINKQHINGLKGGRPENPTKPKKPKPFLINPTKPKKPKPFLINPTKPKKPDNDNVTDNVNDNVNDNVLKKKRAPTTKKTLEFRNTQFLKNLELFIKDYEKNLLNEFYLYWSESNQSKTKMRFELEKTWDLRKRLAKWKSNGIKWNKNNGTNKKESTGSVKSRLDYRYDPEKSERRLAELKKQFGES